MPNRLAKENSPYLLQHAENPVDWFPWGSEALEKAKTEDKPIFLSVGYAACHWCHVMEHESFEDPETAAIMNQFFVNIKVDREERPDIDSIYMQAVVAMTRQGGWPMSVFLTPEGEPFYGGTYFPPTRRYNMPAFQEILFTIAQLWEKDREQLLQSAGQIAQHVRDSFQLQPRSGSLDPEILSKATINLLQQYDWENGGWGPAPKFPQPMVIEYLLQQGITGNTKALEISLHALKAMAKGGMYDVVGGGFARYSVDARWRVPHFEKMLYDNAQLSLVYLHAHLITRDPFYKRICEETLDFILREMTDPEGGFYSSLDADSEGVEGKFYIWSLDDLQKVGFEDSDLKLLIAAYDIQPNGNFEGSNVLQRALSDVEIAEQYKLPLEDIPKKFTKLHTRLREVRSERIRPGTDDKVLTSWNAWMLTAFAEAGRYLQRPDYTDAANKNANFILQELMVDQRLKRSWRKGQANHEAYLEDYASLILALLALYQSNPDTRWYQTALRLAKDMMAHFRNPESGFFDTRDDHENLMVRPKDYQDNATPSGNALAAQALLYLSAYQGNHQWRELAENMLGNLSQMMVRYPTGFGKWLCAASFCLTPTKEIALLGSGNSEKTNALIKVLWEEYRPFSVAAISEFADAVEGPELLANRSLINQAPTAYVCQNFVCQYPVTEPEAFRKLLETSL